MKMAPKSTSSKVQPSALSNEYVTESDEESVPSLSPPPKKTTKDMEKVNEHSQQSDDSEEPEEEESDAETSVNSAAEKEAEETDTPEHNDSDDSSAQVSHISRKRASNGLLNESVRKKAKKSPATVTRINAKTFKAPPGFETVAVGASDYASDTADLFTNLSEKQIWHISAPANLSIQDVETLDIEAVLRGSPILEKGSVSYNMLAAPAKDQVLMLTQGSVGTYQKSEAKISRSFHLRESTAKIAVRPEASSQDTSPSRDTASPSFTAQSLGKSRTPRQQPANLKMRYVPYGANVKPMQDRSTKDVEMQDIFQVPPEIEHEGMSPARQKKSKHKRDKSDASKDEMNLDVPAPEKSERSETSTKALSEVVGSVASAEKKKKKKKYKLVDQAGL